MFIDIDYNKRPKKSSLLLAKPNKQIISNISEKTDDTVNIKLGNISELNFSIPFEIDGEKNKHVDLIREKMLIKFSLGTYREWYIVDEITENGDDSDWFNVKAYSLGYELSSKFIDSFVEDSINATETLTKLLEPTIWKIGTIDPLFDEMFRSFDISDSNVLECILEAGETYGALIQWDTENRTISFLDASKNGKFKGMTVDYGRFLQSINRNRTADEMVTRLYVYGNENMTIHEANPTGQGYIEDFSYFIYPFERDENGNVISSSYFMSDELCIALLDHKKLIEDLSPQIKTLTSEKIPLTNQLVAYESNLQNLEGELETIAELLDLAKATENETLITQRKAEYSSKETEINDVKNQISHVKSEIAYRDNEISSLQNQIENDPNFTVEILEELNPYIISKKWADDRYTDVYELYQDGLKKFEELRQPKVVIDVTIDNLLNVIEEQYYWDKIVLGDLIKVKYPQMNIEYMAKIIQITYNLSEDEVSLVVANTTDFLDKTDKLVQLLYSNSSATSLIENNKYKWDKINSVEKEVNAILTQEWDANKNKIIAGVNNTVEIGNRGILIANPDIPLEMVIMQAGIIALTKDGGETWKTAIKPDGIVAERLIGQIIAGQELIITNSSGSFTFDANGVQIDASAFVVRATSSSGDINLVEQWNEAKDFVTAFVDDNIITAYEKRRLKEQWNDIITIYNSIVTRLNNYFSDGGNSNPEVIALHQKYQALYDYLFTETQTDGYALLDEDNITKSTRIDRVIFTSRFKEYEDNRMKVEEILSIRAKDLALEAQATANDAKNLAQEVMDDVVWKIEFLHHLLWLRSGRAHV